MNKLVITYVTIKSQNIENVYFYTGVRLCEKLTNRCDFATRVMRWRYWRRQAFVLTKVQINVLFGTYCTPTNQMLTHYVKVSFDVNAWTPVVADANI